MNSTPGHPTLGNWKPRYAPREAVAVVARGEGAKALARRLLDRSDAQLEQLRAAVNAVAVNTPAVGVVTAEVATGAMLLVAGAFELLPWAPEVVYLGRDSLAPTLLWPVHLDPALPPDLLERALRRHFAGLATPLALVPQWGLALPLGMALPVQRTLVTEFLAREAG